MNPSPLPHQPLGTFTSISDRDRSKTSPDPNGWGMGLPGTLLKVFQSSSDHFGLWNCIATKLFSWGKKDSRHTHNLLPTLILQFSMCNFPYPPVWMKHELKGQQFLAHTWLLEQSDLWPLQVPPATIWCYNFFQASCIVLKNPLWVMVTQEWETMIAEALLIDTHSPTPHTPAFSTQLQIKTEAYNLGESQCFPVILSACWQDLNQWILFCWFFLSA